MFRPFHAVCAVALFASTSLAAIVYEPVQYQYRDPKYDAPAFYYGGRNPLVLAYGANLQARYNIAPATNLTGRITVSTATEAPYGYGAENRGAYNIVNPGLLHMPPVVYSDYLPPGVNGYPYGFNEEAARNEAYANVPLYFRKTDLMAWAHRAHDGTIVVPAQAPMHGTIQMKPMHHAPTTQPSSQPTTEPILIIPKGLLDKKLNAAPAPVAAAN